jgi:hypothetical protein
MPRVAIRFLLASSLLACATDKGAEDDPLVDGKADSFYKPTPHGELAFGSPNQAEVTDAETFHSWTFTLTDDATISLKTDIQNNLDTVMYLYRRDAGSTASFGSYIEKNDDAETDSLYSQIDLEAGPGEYRIIVKPFKTAMRGEFEVNATCSGAGCPTAGTCVATQFGTLPTSRTMISEGCATGLVDAMTTKSTSQNTTTTAETSVCTLNGLSKQSADLFRAYWDEMGGWDAFKDGDMVDLEVTTTKHGTATEVMVDTGFDEDAITFVYGPGDTLLSLFQHNQSPDSQVFCAQSGTIAAPDASCMEYMDNALVHKSAEMTGSGTTTYDDANADLPPLVDSPVYEFTGRFSIASTTNVTYQYRTWESDAGLLGAIVTLSASGHTATYTVGTTFRDTTQIFASKVDGTFKMNCQEL